MKINVKNNIFWVGKTDWELRKFHGDEYSTHHGTTYNSYLVQEEKTVLIDTVWNRYSKEFLHNLANEIDLKKIDYIICNHAESDHSGALPDLMDRIPGTPIYCTENGVKSLKGHYQKNWNFQVVKTGDTLNIGNRKEIIFIQAPMLHWPDSMFCYLTGDNVLFSNDAFGQHYCSENLFNDLVNQEELYAEAIKYFANILTPFSPLVIKKIEEFVSLNLPLDMICTSHGVIWRNEPLQIVQKYMEWSNAYQQDQITIVYDTMWDGTRMIAENIAKGIRIADESKIVKLFNASNTDKNDLITEIFKSKLILVGSPTINKGIMHSIAGLLELMKGLKMKNKKAISFGCHGWHNESVEQINACLKNCGFELISEGIKVNWKPDESTVKSLIETGSSLVTQ
ncbi:Anaerobic nitric oxide reductase flavorubredoxin [bioreactor metagenome]|uniref:Anaerobic nitric oxide reductase flavorubredoxin n=1 Tax=bioreactor metagenome TaxID=1076179 RepID=A0A644YRH9_9ZZZZ